jgi:sugar phosphate isomerase/epimerase
MFSLSTSWNSSRHNSGVDLVKEIKAIGFNTIELNFALTRKIVDQILSKKEKLGITVSSLHNMCPLPDELDPKSASPDHYSLASGKIEERSRAVEVAKNTILYANKFEAKAVILHTGRVEMKDRTRELASLVGERAKYEELKRSMIEERKAKKGAHLENLMKSLDELVPYSKKMDVALAVETRYYYREIPILEEFEEIFSHYRPDELYYWHDAGHAEVFERLGLAEHKAFLDRFSNRLIGVHLHDIIGVIGDHNAPGFGTFNFNILKPYISEETIKVIEAHPPASAGEIEKSVEFLKGIFGA